MGGRIPAEFIDQLLSRIDIVDVIGDRIPLRKAGRDFQALCPFHHEKTPSFTVSPTKQFYHCFGCGAHGTVIGFLMDYERLDFVAAVEDLARIAGLTVPEQSRGERKGPDPQPLFDALDESARFFRKQLGAHPQAARAQQYLRARGLDPRIARDFLIGYAPPGWDNLQRTLGEDTERRKRLIDAGLLIAAENRVYDRFRDRIIFPIRDQRGRIIGFGGRSLDNSPPKYLNSPETELFHKGKELYGLFEARKSLPKLDRLLVVEGYMDVIALAQGGIRYSVATLGTAITGQHAERLFRATPKLVFCFDGDAAGRAAAWRALEAVLPQLRDGREATFLFLPDGEDPDSLVRKEGSTDFSARIDDAMPLSDFLFAHVGEQASLAHIDGRARFAEISRPLIDRAPPGLWREMMLQRLSELVHLPVGRLQASTHTTGQRVIESPATGRPRPVSAVRQALTILVQHPELARGVDRTEDQWSDFDAPGFPLLLELLDLLHTEPNLTTVAVIERRRGSETAPLLMKLAAASLSVPEDGLLDELRGAMARIADQARNQRIEKLFERARTAPLSEEERARLRALLAERAQRSKD